MTEGSDTTKSYGSLAKEESAVEAMISDLATALGVDFGALDPVTSPCPDADQVGQERVDLEIDVDVDQVPAADALDRAQQVLDDAGYSTERTSVGVGRYVVGERGDASLTLGVFEGPPRVTIQANTGCYDA